MQWLGASKYETLLCAHSADGHLVAAVAQRIEHRSSEPSVGGSNPSSRTKETPVIGGVSVCDLHTCRHCGNVLGMNQTVASD